MPNFALQTQVIMVSNKDVHILLSFSAERMPRAPRVLQGGGYDPRATESVDVRRWEHASARPHPNSARSIHTRRLAGSALVVCGSSVISNWIAGLRLLMVSGEVRR